MTGTILGISNGKAIVQHNDSKPNRNILVVGGPGSYKTQSVVITNIFNETENSIVATDPKGEIYEKTAHIKRLQGYEVHVVNFDNMTASDRVNNLDYVEKDIHAQSVATKIVDSANKDGKKDVWYYSQRALLTSLILYVVNEFEPKKRNIGGILDFLQQFNIDKDENEESELDRQFYRLDVRHPARRSYELGFKKARGEMQGSIIMSLLTTLSSYTDNDVDEFTSYSDFNLADVGRKKIALYVIIPVMDQTWEGLINIFFTQMFDQLYKLASNHNAKLPVNVNFILDEFVNLGKFPNFEEFLATCRGYGIGVTVIVQTITQLYNKYNQNQAESIIGNCGTKIMLNAANEKTAVFFRNILDKTTVKVETEGETKQHGGKEEGSKGSTSENYSYISRDLMTTSEIINMPDDTSLVICTNQRPIKAKKAFQFKLFPNYAEKYLLNQSEYERYTSEAQLERLERLTHEFNEKKGLKQQQAEELLSQHDKEKEKKAEEKEQEMLAEAEALFFEDSDEETEEIEQEVQKEDKQQKVTEKIEEKEDKQQTETIENDTNNEFNFDENITENNNEDFFFDEDIQREKQENNNEDFFFDEDIETKKDESETLKR